MIYKLPGINRTLLIYLTDIFISAKSISTSVFVFPDSDKINRCVCKRLCFLFKISPGPEVEKKNSSLKVLDQSYQEGEPLLTNKECLHVVWRNISDCNTVI